MPPTITSAEAFREALLHQDHALLGRPLLPFCLRHFLLLEAAGSPLIIPGRPISASDLILFTACCSSGTDREFWRAVRMIGEERPGITWVGWWGNGLSMSVEHILPVALDYIADFFPAFPLWEPDEESETRCPAMLVAAARLLDCWTRDEIMNAPLGEVLAWGMARAESKGFPPENLATDLELAAAFEIKERKRARLASQPEPAHA